jgi:hypothetical protein
MNSYEFWSLVVGFTSVVVNIVVFGVLAWQLRLLAQQITLAKISTERDHDRRRKQATLDFSIAMLARQVEMRDRGVPNDFDSLSVSAFQQKALDGDVATSELLGAYLNLFETLGNGVRFDVLDISVLDRGLGRRIAIVGELYRLYIEDRRAFAKNQALFGDLEWLADKIRSRRGPDLEWIEEAGSLLS